MNESLPHEVEHAIRIDGLNHYFGEGEFRRQALHDIDLEVEPGEVVTLTGPSGCGKTTLLTIVGALRRVQEGHVQILGEPLETQGERDLVRLRKRIGFIFQAHNLFPSLTALENVRMAVELDTKVKDPSTKVAADILNHLGLGERIQYKPGRLSGGQRQRVAIARALVNRPKLILADEPTAALDEESGNIVMELLKEFAKKEGSAVIIVTHDQRVLRSANRIVSMNFGRVIANVLKEETTLVCEFLARLEAFQTLPPATLADIATKMLREKYPPGSVLFEQGEPGEKFYIIRRGLAEVTGIDSGGESFRRILKEGDAFGEIALLKDVPRTATVKAFDNLEVYSLGKKDFRNAVDAGGSFSEQIWKAYFSRQ